MICLRCANIVEETCDCHAPLQQPPPFRIEEWVSREDLQIVRKDREEQHRMWKNYLSWHVGNDRQSAYQNMRGDAMIDEMCGHEPERIQAHIYAVWDCTHDWDQTVSAYDAILQGAPIRPLAKMAQRPRPASGLTFRKLRDLELQLGNKPKQDPVVLRRIRDLEGEIHRLAAKEADEDELEAIEFVPREPRERRTREPNVRQ